MFSLVLAYPCSNRLMVVISLRCFSVPALLSNRTISCKAFGFGRDVVSLPWICAYLEGEALLGLSGKKGSCLPRLCILGRPSFEFSGSSEISKITAQVLLAIQVL